MISCRRLAFQVLNRNYAKQIGAGPSKKMSTSKLMLISLGMGGLIGTAYTGYLSITSGGNSGLTTQIEPAVIDKFPDNIKITRKIYNPNDNTDLDLVLFQYQTCPFCCKVSVKIIQSQQLKIEIILFLL